MAEEKIAPGAVGTEAKGIRYTPPSRDNRGIQSTARRSFLGTFGKAVLGAVGIAIGGAAIAEGIKRMDQPTPTEQEGQRLGAANQAMQQAEQNKQQADPTRKPIEQATGQNIPPALK